MLQGNAIARQHPRDHAIEGRRTLSLALVAGAFPAIQAAQGVELADAGEGAIERIEKAALDAFALQTQITHRFEIQVLVAAFKGLVGHLEQGVVGVVEQALQALTQLQCSFVPHLQEHHRKARQRRARAPVDGCRQRHHLAFFMHPELLAGSLARQCNESSKP
ncbi:hypothetical protein D3C81_1003660 [compost metagenome]